MVSSEQGSETLLAALHRIKDAVSDICDPGDSPDLFVRQLHRAWKEKGGIVAGKARHSDRFLDEKLKANNTPVRSLSPKLAGKTRIKPRDGRWLVDFFLLNWPLGTGVSADEEENRDGNDALYKPLLPVPEIRAVSSFVATGLGTPIHSQVSLDVAPNLTALSLPGEDIVEVLTSRFEDCLALLTVSAEQTLIVSQPNTELIGFREAIDKMWAIELADEKPRPLIWALDIGRKIFGDLESRMRYLNVHRLIVRFKALKDFRDDPSRRALERWTWLTSRAVIILLDTTNQEDVNLHRFKRPNFLAHHVAFTAVPQFWLASPNFRALYGANLERLDHRNFSVFLNPSEAQLRADLNDDLRYYGYALFSPDSKKSEALARGLELPSPGWSYNEASKTVCTAAFHLLSLDNPLADQLSISGVEAVTQLRYLGFRVLNLENFMEV